MVEILVFALLALYLSIRLWNVLGTNADIETSDPKEVEDNVVIMPKPERENAIVIEGEAEEIRFGDETAAIQKFDATFSTDAFVRGAERAFAMIVSAYANDDLLKLKKLLTPKAYDLFEQGVEMRKAKNLVSHVDISNVHGEIQYIDVLAKAASITVRFESDQCIYTTDAQDNVIDNKAKITTRMVDDWTFTRNFTKASKIWLLSDTKSVDV